MAVVIGLTGGIASGKSTVAHMMEELEIPVVDADKIAKEVVEVGTDTYHQIVQTFGEEILQKDRSIDRVKLGAIIFQNKEEREKLNAIVHPAVRQSMLRQKEQFLQDGNEIVVLDIPLLFESDLTHLVDRVIVVYVDEDVQLARLMKRNGLTEEEAKSRIQSQMPLVQKIALADSVINNNGSIEETKVQLLSALAYLNK
ncbi:dephospho-CoA kinase [Bacillus sp. CGMCC 1.16541]|uniref:dephospho-CoA kinase n=1 Tax=Bacillus sp. CGMCC 1.16541 TaxID=2185143 RepID=UPI000D734151|nr:dephospho-CoA kinase [Bacillus sp. CGMCC 1.16541]